MTPRIHVSPLTFWTAATSRLPISRTLSGSSKTRRWIGRTVAVTIGAALAVTTAACASGATQTGATPSSGSARPAASATSALVATATPTAKASPSSTPIASATPEGAAAATSAAASATVAPKSQPTTQSVAPAATPAAADAARPSDTSPTPGQPAPSPTAGQPTATAAPATAASSKPSSGRTTQSWVDGPADLSRDQATGAQLSNEGARLGQGDGGYVAAGELLSDVREADFPFNNAVLSWNADAPPGTSLRLELRVRTDGGWSNWYAMGEWSSEGGRSIAGQSDANGKVDVDTLKLTATATALQYRVKLNSSASGNSPLLRQVSVVYADMRRGLSGPPVQRPAGAVRDLQIPGYSQLEEDPSVAREICSPTSLTMVLQYWGSKVTVPEAYAGVKDQTTGIFGNWPLNTAFAGANGFSARVDRFYSIEQLEQEIAAGRPPIISVAYSAGEITGAATPSTDGHLIVVRGFTADGNVIVNDPIAPNSKSVRLVYNRDQLSRVWLRSGGIVYLISPR